MLPRSSDAGEIYSRGRRYLSRRTTMHVVELYPQRLHRHHHPHHNALQHRRPQRRHQLSCALSKPLQQHRLRRSIHGAYRLFLLILSGPVTALATTSRKA